MSRSPLSNEGIEDAYEQLGSIIKRLPENEHRNSAEHHLELSEAAAHRAAEIGPRDARQEDGC